MEKKATTPQDPNNALTRIHKTIERAISKTCHNDTKCSDVWKRVFNVEGDNRDLSTQKNIITYLMRMDDEICNVLKCINNGECLIPAHKLDNQLIAIRHGISPVNLNRHWGDIRIQFFTTDNIAAIQYSSYSLSSDEEQLDYEEIEELKELCQALQSALKDSTELPDAIKEVLLRKVNAIYIAIESIHLFGIKEWQEATFELAGLLKLVPETCETIERSDTNLWNGLTGYFKKASSLLNNAGTIIRNAESLKEFSSGFLEILR